MPNKIFSFLSTDWRPTKRRKTLSSLDLDTALDCLSHSEERENQSDLEENQHLTNKKLTKNGGRLTGVRKENLLANKDGRLSCGKDGQATQPLGTQQQLNNQHKRQRKANPDRSTKCGDDEGKQSNLELLRKIFPGLSTPELAAVLSTSNGELVKAIQHLVLKKQPMVGKADDHQQVAFKQALIDQDSIAGSKRKGSAVPFHSSASKQQLTDGLLNENNVLTNLKTNLQTNLQHMQSTAAAQKPAHSPLFNSPCQSPLSSNLHSQLFKEAFRGNGNLFFNGANPAKTTDSLCSPTATSGGAIQQVPNSSALNTISNSISNSIQVNHLLAQHSPGNSQANSASYLSMLASMSNQVENNCFNNQNLFDPILHPLNDAMLAMTKRTGNGLYNGQMPSANNKNGNHNNSLICNLNSNNLNNQLTSAFQRSILNETNNNAGFPYPLYPFLFNTTGDLTGQPTDNSLKSSLVAAIAQQKAAHLQQQAGLNGTAAALQSTPFPPNEAMLMGTFGHLLTDPETGDLKAAKEKNTSLTSGSSQCSSPETSSRSPIKYGA